MAWDTYGHRWLLLRARVGESEWTVSPLRGATTSGQVGARMNVVHERCAGLDVHKKTVVACVLRSTGGSDVDTHIRTFGTMTVDLEELGCWLAEWGCTHVAMEATGAYWKPVYNVLEERGDLQMLVINA